MSVWRRGMQERMNKEMRKDNGLRMSREEECVMEEEIGVLHSGKIFWYNRKRTVADREEKHSEIEERDTGVVLQFKGIQCIRKRKRMVNSFQQEGDPLHPIPLRLDSMSNPRPCVHLKI
jgi:hypothetical protein